MNDVSRWLSLPVNEFFHQGNWSGKAFQPEAKSSSPPPPLTDSWQISSVKAFFSTFPWSGVVAVNQPANESPPLFLEESDCLTISVKEFFNLVPWGAGVGVTPAVAKPVTQMEFPAPVAKQHTIDDLAQLF